ncbi:MAG: hypothetical protein KAQ94_01850 [Arcobacteraceae bacterium]|nr:hypothetical protein [Arcobacteraceae bacterium]
MNKFLILIVFIIGIMLTFIVLNNNYTQNIDKLNELYTNNTSIIKDNSIKRIKEAENKSLNALQKLKNNINIQANNLMLSKKRLSKIRNNLDLYKKQQIDNFINERKKDILFISRITIRQKLLNSFYHTNKVNGLPIYREISFFNLKGKEIYKKSSIEVLKMNISKKKNTYCQKETYFNEIDNLQEGQIYISKTVSCKNNKDIIRIITPIFRKFKKVGFLSAAVDYRYIDKIKKDLQHIKG